MELDNIINDLEQEKTIGVYDILDSGYPPSTDNKLSIRYVELFENKHKKRLKKLKKLYERTINSI